MANVILTGGIQGQTSRDPRGDSLDPRKNKSFEFKGFNRRKAHTDTGPCQAGGQVPRISNFYATVDGIATKNGNPFSRTNCTI